MDGAELAKSALGIGVAGDELNVLQMAVRAVTVYIVTLAIVRLGKKRFMGRGTAFDMIIGIVLGSVVSRAITGNAPLGPTLGAAGTLVLLHWLLSAAALRWPGLSRLARGHPTLLVQDGEVDQVALRQVHMCESDLMEDIRGKSVSSLDQVAEGRLECNGEVSVLKRRPEPKIVDVRIEGGVQIVRIEIG